MTNPKGPKDQPDRNATGGTPSFTTMPGTQTHAAPETIFDPELFEELRATIGTARLHLALADLAATVRATFLEAPAAVADPDITFQTAHKLTGRAGLMGFTALQNACVQLQQACEGRGPFDGEFAWARRVSRHTLEVISALLKG
jgi:HPt (histidine-containing phosphotransfer) domain-containing protein